MNLDKLNKWLTLIANLGVLAGIIIVAFELQQTRLSMNAESSNLRTELSRQTQRDSFELGIPELQNKIEGDVELDEAEIDRARMFYGSVLRFIENLHYQYQIGVLDEEIWQSNEFTINRMCTGQNQLFSYVYPDGVLRQLYRSSFMELLTPPCEEQSE